MHYTFPGPAGCDPELAFIVDMVGLALLAILVGVAFWWAWKKGKKRT